MLPDIQSYIMSQPHQRVQSGKLRKTSKRNSQLRNSKLSKEVSNVYIGIENATHISQTEDYEDYLIHLQTPNKLTSLQVDILSDIILGWGGNINEDIDPTWRLTWNIGTWSIGKNVSLSINMIQPNIANAWINVSNVSENVLKDLAFEYNSYNLERSICKVQVSTYSLCLQILL